MAVVMLWLVFITPLIFQKVQRTNALVCPSSIKMCKNSSHSHQWCFILRFDKYSKFDFLLKDGSGFHRNVMYGCDAYLQQGKDIGNASLRKLAKNITDECDSNHVAAGVRSGVENEKPWRASFCCYDDRFKARSYHWSTWLRFLLENITTSTTTTTIMTAMTSTSRMNGDIRT